LKKPHKTGYRWNSDVYVDRTYTSPSGDTYDLDHLRSQNNTYKYQYRDSSGQSIKGSIDIEVRYDPHCFTREREPQDIGPALVYDCYSDGSQSDRVFDLERYNKTKFLVGTIKNLSNKDCRESRNKGKVLYFKQSDRTRPKAGYYVIIKVKNHAGKLVMHVETAHDRNNEPYKLNLSDKSETYKIILGRLISSQWPELLN
jgi:hypothetical protein